MLELEGALEPDRLAVLALEALVVADQRAAWPSARSWRSSSESPKPPRRQPASSSPSSSGSDRAPAPPAWKRSSTWWTRIPKRWFSVGSLGIRKTRANLYFSGHVR